MKLFRNLWSRFSHRRSPGYTYPVDEAQYERNPLKPRTSEVSQFQDEARDIETRGPERRIYEENVYENGKDTDHGDQNPSRLQH